MKKLIALILAMLMCLAGLSACTAVVDPGTETTTDAPETGTAAPETDAPETQAPAETDAPETQAPAETETAGTQAPETEPETTPATPDVEYDLEAAAEYVNSLYKKGETITAADYEVVGQVMIAGVKYMVTWTVDNDQVKLVEGSPYWTVDVDEKAKEEHSYKITATITAGDGTTTSVSFDRTVPEYVLWSFEEYINAPEGTTVVIEGIVVAMNGKSVGNTRNHLFLADVEGKGGYYCYQLDTDPVEAGIKVGMTVAVTAVTAPYSGMQETKGGTFTIVDETIKTVEPFDITDKFVAGESLKNYVGLPVVIKGVTIGTQDLTGTSQYLYFERDGQKAYVRSYITDFPTSLQIVKGENNTVSSPDKDAMDADHAAHFGYTADATGVLVLYSGAPYLIPLSVTPFTNYEFVEMTADEKIAAELGDLKLDASASSDVVIDLLSVGKYYNDVTFAWATDDTTGAATIDGGKLSLVIPDAQVTVNVTVTATCGDATATKTFAIKLSKTITSVEDIIEIGAAKDHNTYTDEKYIAGGIIVEIQNNVYGNIVIKDESGKSILVYGTFIDGKKYGEFEGDKPVVGDYVVVIGIVGQYNGTAQMKNADITSFTKPSALKDALDAGAAQEHNTYTTEKYLVTGVVTEIANTTYGNLYIQDAEGNTLYIYGLYNQANVRFDKLATKPVVGDTITVLSTAGQYNGTPQLKNAVLVSLTIAENGGDDDNDDPSEETGPVEMTIPEANAAADGTDVIVIGTVQEINTEWSDQYNNITVTIVDDEGNTLYIYRLATKVNVGDKIKITGKVGSYNGSKQIAAGATAEVLAAAPSEMTIPEVLAAEDGTDVIVRGTVKEINTPWSDQYGNITVTIQDAEGNTLYVYRMKTNVKVGDVITITGKVGSYNGSKQIAAGATAVIESTGDDSGDDTPVETDPVEMTIPEALEATDGTKVIVTGTVKEINTAWSEQYNNITVTIVDAEGNTLYIYRLATKVNVGDEITVTGDMATYNGSRQIAAGATAEIVSAHTTCTFVDSVCTVCGAIEPSDGQTVATVTIADYAAANGWANSTFYGEINVNDDITVTAVGGQNTGKYYTSGENWRIYQNESPAVTITAANGKTIAAVKITYTSQNTGVLTLDGATVESGAVVTVNANSITFSVGNTGTATNGQARITAIEVIYQ